MGEAAYWAVARRRWQVVVAFAQFGVGAALAASEVFDSSRPLRDLIVGLVAGVLMGFVAVRPVEQLASPPPVARRTGRHSRRKPRARARQADVITVRAALWPDPQL